MVSPYLERPLRTLEQARGDRARAASKRAPLVPNPVPTGFHSKAAGSPASAAKAFLRLLMGRPMASLPAPGPPPCRALAAMAAPNRRPPPRSRGETGGEPGPAGPSPCAPGGRRAA
jgi:hypothetical protein